MTDAAEAHARERISQLFAEHRAEVTRFVVRRVGVDAAADIVSETFLTAWRRAESIPPGHEQAWLFATARFVIGHEIRSTARRQDLHARAAVNADQVAASYASGNPADAIVDQIFVRNVLSRLSAADQEVLRLIEWDRLSQAEAAKVLNCSVAAFKVRLFRARRRFCNQLCKHEAASTADEDEALAFPKPLSRLANEGTSTT